MNDVNNGIRAEELEFGDKTIGELINVGLKFYIPDYQRGYRWGKQQAEELLDDLYAFSNKTKSDKELYYIQPLVIKWEKVKEEIRYRVVDGQQRLTTIYLLLRYLGDGPEDLYSIEYQTRNDSAEFLKEIDKKSMEDSKIYIDFYHMWEVYDAIKGWFGRKELDKDNIDKLKKTLIERVAFICYPIDEEEDEMSVFTRLNIGRIPLTDSELIKALFLNRANYVSSQDDIKKQDLETQKRAISAEWNQIEYSLQNDELWYFLQDDDYKKTTRIDFILDMICEFDEFDLFEWTNKNKVNLKDTDFNAYMMEKIGNDEHKTFRYFHEAFLDKREKSESNSEAWLAEMWDKVRKYHHIFNEWYHDFEMYHYIGYLVETRDKSKTVHEIIHDCVEQWNKNSKNKFVTYLKGKIKEDVLEPKNCFKNWFNATESFETHNNRKYKKPGYIFEQEDKDNKKNNTDSKTTSKCVLLLHNIETIIQQNKKRVEETKYNLPDFSKFPFHLFKKDSWDVEHIRPNSSDKLKSLKDQKIYLLLVKCMLEENEGLDKDKKIQNDIDAFFKNDNENAVSMKFQDLLDDINQIGSTDLTALGEDEKNMIWNYTLLDSRTNRQYGNYIFPIKRSYIIDKESGIVPKYDLKDNKSELKMTEKKDIVAFIPPCTKNIFMKFYTKQPSTMLNWNDEDAQAYWIDMNEKLKFYIDEEIEINEEN